MAMAMLRKPSGRYVLHEGGVPNGAAASPNRELTAKIVRAFRVEGKKKHSHKVIKCPVYNRCQDIPLVYTAD